MGAGDGYAGSSRTPDRGVWREELPYTATGKVMRQDGRASSVCPRPELTALERGTPD